MLPKPHDVVIFDLDGTLSDPVVGIARSINHALAHYGYAQVDPDRLAVYIGPPLDQAFSAITGVTADAELRGFVSKYRERYAEVGYSENTLYPGIPEALRALTAAGATLGVCTSKRVDFAEQILNMFGLRSHFRFVSGGDVGIQKWQQLESLLAQRQISRSSIMVGDRAVDLSAAHRNGMQSAGVLWGHGSRAELENERPSCLLASPAELVRFAGI